MLRMLLPCTLLLVGSFSSATAQQAPVAPGTRVRVVTLDLPQRSLAGELLSLDADSIHLRRKHRPVAVPLSALTRLEVSRGPARKRGWIRGAGIGALAAIGGAAVMFGPTGDWGYVLQPAWPVAGALTGSLIGAVLARERWERVPLPGQAYVSPHPNGFRFSAPLTF